LPKVPRYTSLYTASSILRMRLDFTRPLRACKKVGWVDGLERSQLMDAQSGEVLTTDCSSELGAVTGFIVK
jgi:hypothetical protein